ncbi:MAG: hypothetical protein CMK50_00625 [Propionibacteriaceae bacterium]|nr:hypothetical protein [Propionibacteriaceae bacterium]
MLHYVTGLFRYSGLRLCWQHCWNHSTSCLSCCCSISSAISRLRETVWQATGCQAETAGCIGVGSGVTAATHELAVRCSPDKGFRAWEAGDAASRHHELVATPSSLHFRLL